MGVGVGWWFTYMLKCSVDCLRDAADVVVAVFLRILWKQQLTKVSDCSVYFHNSSRGKSATLKPPRLQRRNIMGFLSQRVRIPDCTLTRRIA